MKIGFIGLGNMGSAMAMNLLKAGHNVTVYNRTAQKAKPLVDQGAHAAADPAEASRADVVFTMLADDRAVESVSFGESGILAHLQPGSVHISSSTISVDLSQKLAAAHEKQNQQFIAAPVFGRPEAAAAGKLIVVVAGRTDAIDRCTPLFDVIGQRTFRFGVKPSAANLIKLSGNFLIASVLESLSEAMALVCKAGIDQHEYVDFLTSTLFAAPVYKTYGALIADRKFQPAGFAAPLGAKLFLGDGNGYFRERATRPQTIGYALSDSPAGQAMWIYEKFYSWTDNNGSPEDALSRDQMLDDISLYWFTNTAASSARIYWENKGSSFSGGKLSLPVTATVFPREIYRAPKSWAEQTYSNLIY